MSDRLARGAARSRDRVRRVAKRAIDIFGSVIALVLLTPLIAGTTVLIRAVDGPPVLFRHERPGLGGRPFTMLKFRTMRSPREGESWRMEDGRRVTRLGRVLRTTSIDELPEFWNVLRGDMSLVGPRPLLMAHTAAYTPLERRRHEVPPGMTGWAVINGRHTTSFEERLALDVWYVDHWSLWLDSRIIGMTLAKLVRHSDVAITQDPAITKIPERFEAAEEAIEFETSRSPRMRG